MDILTSGESLWEVRAAFGWRFQLDAETLCCSIWSVYPKGARCETLGRFGNCGVCWVALLVRAAIFLSLALECCLEGRGERTLGHWSLAPGDASKGGAEWASERVALGNCAAVLRYLSLALRNAPSLPPECSVRGGEA